jgi:hypothetical protein
MVSVDLRTRTEGDIRSIEAGTFFADEWPALLENHEQLALPGARELGPRPLTLEVDGEAWTLVLGDDGVRARPGGSDGAARVVLDGEQFADLINDVLTPMGLFTGGMLTMPSGRLEDFLDWWVILRSLVDGRPVHTRGAVTFSDARGGPLDLHRRFGVEDDPVEMAWFLAEAGYLHLRGVFDEREMAAVSDDIDAALPQYRPDDGRSWWARTDAGEYRAVRLQYFQEHSPTTARLLTDDRLTMLADLTEDGMHRPEGNVGWNVIEALVKPIGVIEGISDVPWHKDCSLGRHSYRCCSLTVGISVTGADASSGQLRVVAGSHRALIQPAFVRRGLDLPQIDLPTETGDLTVHLSCTMHMSVPPTSRERRVMYTGFTLPTTRTSSEQEAKLRRIREGSYKTVSQTPAPRGAR